MATITDSQFAALQTFAAAFAAVKVEPAAKAEVKAPKKALVDELAALRAEMAAMRGEKVQAAKVEAAKTDYSAVWTALKAANISHYGSTVKASSWASAQLDPIFGAAFGSKVGEAKKGSTAWEAAIEAGKAAQKAATPAILASAAKLSGVDFAKLVG
jgi:hypothetical protein